MARIKDILQHTAEFFLILIYMLAAFGEVTSTEPTTTGVLGWLFSDPTASWIYAIWFVTMSLTLLLSKIFRKHKVHKHALAAMYLTTVYTISLAVALFGFGNAAIVDDGIIGAVAAICWLRWKLNTEYISIEELDAYEA